jgi:2-methylcitrate dehydratase PrpD
MKNEESISQILSEYYLAYDNSQIPEKVIKAAKIAVADYIGCAIGGSRLESTEAIKSVMMRYDVPDGTRVITGGKAPAENAAFINGASGHSLEMDDAHYRAGGHAAVVIIPAAMAVAEEQGRTGRDFLHAVIWGYDMMTRVGQAGIPDNCFERGWHPTAVFGIFGATVAASFLYGLSAEEMKNAIGIAGGFASGNLECYADGTLTKRLNPGNAAWGGVIAAKLAQKGYSGPKWIFEGGCGFLKSYTDNAVPENMLKDLDYSDFPIEVTSYKPYACCRYNHAPIDSVLAIMGENSLSPDDIEEISVDVVRMALRAVVEPQEMKYNPPSVVGAQFSLPYSVAVAALFGSASVREYREELLSDAVVKEMMGRVKMTHTGKLDKYIEDNIYAANVTIKTKKEDIYTKLTTFSKGDPDNPMSEIEMKVKFQSLAALNISDAKRIDRIWRSILSLDGRESFLELLSLI